MLKHLPLTVISVIILIAIAVAATIPATSSGEPASIYSKETEDLRITDCIWAPDSSHANFTVSNFGAYPVSISEIQLYGVAAADYVFLSGDSTVDAGDSVLIHVLGFFSGNSIHQFSIVTSNGATFVFTATAPEPSSTSILESETTENATDEVIQENLDEDFPAGGGATSSQSDDFAEESPECSVEPPTNVTLQDDPDIDPSYSHDLDVQAQQCLADISARKALLLNYSELQNSEVNGENGLIWEPIDAQVTFHVRKTGDYWEAVQEDSQRVVFGGPEGFGGVHGSNGEVVLNAAINAASVAGGGRVIIGCGVLVANSIVPKSCVEVCGEGKGTVLRQNANANTIFIHSAEKIVNFSMHNLTIDYNHQNQFLPKEGMWIGHASEYLHFYNLWIENCKKFGIHLASLNQPNDPPISCENVKVEDIIFTDVVAENWDLCVVASHGGCVRNVTIYGLHRNAGVVAFEGTNLLVTDCHITIASQDGDVVGGIWLGSCNYSLCANNTVVGQAMNCDYETVGIRVNTEHDNTKPRGSYKNLVANNLVSTIKYGIMLEETSDDYVVFNTLTDCANGVVFPNYGFPAAIDTKIMFNSLNNVTAHIREFVSPVGMQQYFNDGSTSYTP